MPKLTFHGHSVFVLESNGTHLVFDPFINGNPLAKIEPADIKADYVLLTHGHGDHVGDAIEIAKNNNATVISVFEVVGYCQNQGVENAHPMHIGGGYDFPFGRVKLTNALHGSGLPDGSYGGNPAGIIVTTGGKTIYHMGDTGLFGDLKTIVGAYNDIDVCLIPIGDNFTMGIEDALIAAEWIGAKLYIPMHYNTFPIIPADPQEFIDKLEEKGLKGQVMASGETIEI